VHVYERCDLALRRQPGALRALPGRRAIEDKVLAVGDAVVGNV
jgi:hypothetical protein